MRTAILACSCAHPYQDARYGKGKRVHNYSPKTPPKWVCTVCRGTKPAPNI